MAADMEIKLLLQLQDLYGFMTGRSIKSHGIV